MFHIYIATPTYNNSNYTAHIIEHCVFGKIDQDNFFQAEIITEWTSTYYTYYILDSDNKDDLELFIQQITKEIPNSLINYEHEVLKKECENNNYNQKLIQKIWQSLYWNNFKYTKSWRKIYSQIKNYHQYYYTREKIIVLENDTKYFDWEITPAINIIKKIKLKIWSDKDTVYIIKHWITELYIISLLSDLIDKYIKLNLRFLDGEYNTNSYETIYWDYDKHIFLAITPSISEKVKNINSEFIKNYTQYSLLNNKYIEDKDFDGSCMVKYWYTLSNGQKSNILKKLHKHYSDLISQF